MNSRTLLFALVGTGVFLLFFISGGGLDGPSKPSLGEYVAGEVTPR
jgi:hypothetical protein